MKISYTDEFQALKIFKDKIKDESTPTKIVIDLEQLPDVICGNKRTIVYQLLNAQGEILVSGQGWSLNSAFEEAKDDFFDIALNEEEYQQLLSTKPPF